VVPPAASFTSAQRCCCHQSPAFGFLCQRHGSASPALRLATQSSAAAPAPRPCPASTAHRRRRFRVERDADCASGSIEAPLLFAEASIRGAAPRCQVIPFAMA
jgi:hypothetical protein